MVFCNNKLLVLFCDSYVSIHYDTRSKLSSSKPDHALICLSIVVYLTDYRWGCEALKCSIWYAWPHQCGVFVWVVFGSTRHGHCWAEVCDSAVTGWSSWSQLHYTLDKQIKNSKKRFISCFSVIKYTYGNTRKDSALPKQSVRFSCMSGSGRAGYMMDYIFPNIYTIYTDTFRVCVIIYFQRICEHTALEQMCTAETGQRIQIKFLHNH